MGAIEWWATLGLGSGITIILQRTLRWLRAHESATTPTEYEQMCAALTEELRKR